MLGYNISTCGGITSVQWGDNISTVEDIQYSGGYLQYSGGITSVQWGITSVQWGITSVLWRLLSTVEIKI